MCDSVGASVCCFFAHDMPGCVKTPPHDTHDRQQRNSRIVNRYDSEDNLWDAVRDGVIVSTDLDERMMPKLSPSPRLPSYQRQEPAWPATVGPPPPAPPPASPALPAPPPKPPRPPLGDVTNVAAQQEIAMLKKHLKLQGDVINGLCRLRTFEAEQRGPV